MGIKINHDCKTELREADLKATPARIALMRFLESSSHPVDVSSMQEYLSRHNIDADPATVFRIVNMFTQKGLTRQIQFLEGKFRYELADKADHHHLICEQCGMIEDFSDCAIPDLEKDIQKKKRFLVKSHSLEFFGLCKNCQ